MSGAAKIPAADASYDLIVQAVLRAILDGRLAPGARLTERWIVEACDCTHTAARDAINRLETLGAVVASQRRGARVVSRLEAPLDEIDRVWRQLLGLVVPAWSEVAARGEAWDRLMEEQGRLETARASSGARLVDLLKRLSLQRAIVGGNAR